MGGEDGIGVAAVTAGGEAFKGKILVQQYWEREREREREREKAKRQTRACRGSNDRS